VDAIGAPPATGSSDFSYYTKRAMLAGVYGTTICYWFSDSSEGHAAPLDLSRSIASTM
jgi:ubiquinone biosynthesis protein COQ9